MPDPIIQHAIAEASDDGARLDKVAVARLPDLSRTQAQEHIRSGRLSVNGRTVIEPGHKVKRGDALRLETPPPRPAEPQPEAIPLTVVYEDDQLIVIDKPAGMVVHPAPGARDGTLVNALIAHCGASLSGVGGVMRPGVVHRLDKDTTGLMVVAKTDAAHRALAAQFADHGRTGALERRYLALVWGEPQPPSGALSAPIARHPASRLKMAVTRKGGRIAVTHYERLETFDCGERRDAAAAISLMSCRLETGRTHQVRVHMAHLGHPLMGDALYGAGFSSKTRVLPEPLKSEIISLKRQALHAETLAFEHPKTRKTLRFSSAPHDDMMSIIKILRSCHHKA
ncbi:MAG: RluA family pseudouridine synthase [Hyphomicrobiales bacterium]|nr:RluA family pseudouridine synthase [Hyphomicrobiales bacterium]